MSNTSRDYTKRREEVRQLGAAVTAQNYVDLKAMAAVKGVTVGQFLDEMIEREVARRVARMERRKADAASAENVVPNM